MPSHKIYIKIALDVNKKLKIDNGSIIFSSVLPDLTITKDLSRKLVLIILEKCT